MSGPNAMEVEQSQPVQPSEPGITEDAAASLRAAALKTMKAKRRKGPDGSDVPSTLPPRPTVNTPSIVLDYGSEDQPETSTIIPAVNPTPTSAASTKPSPPPAPVPMEVDEDQTREEGEISDSESMPPPKSPSISRQTPRPASRPTAGRSSTMERPISSPSVPPSISHSNTNVKVEPLPQRIPEPSPAYEMYIVDDDHARPGLSLTEEQYNRGKDALLDLLGWGVPPDYIIDCGVSREMIYYAFTEMNLRLPPNFDTTGLPPALPYISASPEPITPSAHFSRSRRASSAKGPAGDLHPSLPQKPTAPRGSPPTDSTTLSAAAASFVPSATLSAIPMQSADSPPSLIDMEQQRRQELLARKAVLASRKKQVASESMPPSTGARPESKPTVAIPAAVDDFLNSIGSATSDLAVEKAVAENYDDRMDVDDQDVDDQIPGLSLVVPPPATSKLSKTRSPSAESTSPNALLSAAPAELEDSVRSASADQSPPPAEGSESSGDNNTPLPSSAGPRRGAKRPVAADFVDEPATPRPYTHHHQHIHSHHPYARKRTTYFAGLNPHVRRMVIDLSDTEEEGHDNEKDDDDEEDIATQTKRMPSQQPSRPPTRLGLSASLPVTGSLPSPNGLPKAAALHEKEQQIKKMRELIARRERAIMDKLAANSGRSTPMTAANDGIASESPIVVKQEEDSDEVFVESTMAASVQSEPNPRLVSPNGLATPIGKAEHSAADHAVITAEAHHEDMPNASTPVYDSSPTDENMGDMTVDAVRSDRETSSAQASIPDQSNGFTAYHSPLLSYPLLRSHSPPRVRDTNSLAEPSHPSQTPDLSTLFPVSLSSCKAAAVNRWLSDPSRRICQYEVPGGGECRDPGCEDIHPSRAGSVEPSDDAIAHRLFAALPRGSAVTLGQLEGALQDFRRQSLGYEVRVIQALASLGLRMAS